VTLRHARAQRDGGRHGQRDRAPTTFSSLTSLTPTGQHVILPGADVTVLPAKPHNRGLRLVIAAGRDDSLLRTPPPLAVELAIAARGFLNEHSWRILFGCSALKIARTVYRDRS
jgi:hypothetical protein